MKKTKLLKDTVRTILCRRQNSRQQVKPTAIRCWSKGVKPTDAKLIEVDKNGGRLVLSWHAKKDETIHVALIDEMGFCRTVRGKITWTHGLGQANRQIVGLCFEEQVAA